MKILSPVPDRVISTGNNLTPPWEAWFRQLYIYLTEPISGGGAGIVTSVTNENVSQLLAMSDIEEPDPAMPMFGSFQAGAAGLNLQVQYNSGGFLAGSANFTFDGTTATVNALTVTNAVTLTAGTANQVQYLNGFKALTGSANLTFDGTTLTAAGFAGPHNGTVGAGTPNTGAFTTLSASSTVSGTGFSTYLASPPALGSTAASTGAFTTLSASSTVTLSGGTANGLAYLNGSKVLTTGSTITTDGTGNLTVAKALTATGDGSSVGLYLGSSAGAIRYTINGDNYIDYSSGGASGGLYFRRGAGFATAMILDSSGNLTVPTMYSTTVTTPRNVFIDSTGKMGGISSTRASKTNIAALTDVSWLYKLEPVSFNYRKRTENGAYLDAFEPETQLGMIAEQIEPFAPDLCIYDADGKVAGIHYDRMIAPLLKALQDQAARIEALEKKAA